MLLIIVPFCSVSSSQLLRILTALREAVANQIAAVGRKMLLGISQTYLHFSIGLYCIYFLRTYSNNFPETIVLKNS